MELDLKRIRLERNITQKELSELSGIAQSSICEIEKGKYNCNVQTLCALCKALKVTPSELIKKEYWS